jgi:hypothetical protein
MITPIVGTSVICILSCIFLIILSLFCIIFINIFIFYSFYQKKKKTFIIKNKELSDKLVFMNDLNKISFNSIKFDKKNGALNIIGKGASSIVF